MILLDDHLVRDWISEELPEAIEGEGLATTNLWLFRLAGALARPTTSGALTSPLGDLTQEQLDRFRSEVARRTAELTVVPLREIIWLMAELQGTHGRHGRRLGTAMVEALAAAHTLGAGIAVAAEDVGPGLQAAALADGVQFRVIER